MRKAYGKTPIVFRLGVILLCLFMMSFHLMGGLYARYSTSASMSASARVAKFDCEVNYLSTGYGGDNMVIDDKTDWKQVYAVIDEFEVHNSGEVAFSYELKLRLSKYEEGITYENPTVPANSTVSAPRNMNELMHIKHTSLDSNDAVIAKETVSEILATQHHSPDEKITTGITQFEAGKIYYGFSSDGLNYTWLADGEVAQEDGYETAAYPERNLGVSKSHYYKIIYFIDLSEQTVVKEFEPFSLVYSIKCEQID